MTQNFQVSSCFIKHGEVNNVSSTVGQLDHILKYAVFRDINSIANIPFSLVDQILNSPVDNDSKLTRFMNFLNIQHLSGTIARSPLGILKIPSNDIVRSHGSVCSGVRKLQSMNVLKLPVLKRLKWIEI